MRQKSAETVEQINTTNRHESLSSMRCDDDITRNVSETVTANNKQQQKFLNSHQSTYMASWSIKL
jgi:ATP-dependent Zn protease